MAAAILMSLQFIITLKREQINHFARIAMGAGVREQHEEEEIQAKARQSAGVLYRNSPLPRIFVK